MKRATVLAVAAACAAAFLAAMRGDESSAQAAVRGAVAKTLEAGSSRFTITMNGPGLGAEGMPGVEGLVDYVHHRGRISYWESEFLLDGDVAYMSWPMPWRAERRWVKYEAPWGDPDPFSLEEWAMRDPAGLLGFLSAVGTDVRGVGTEEVRGTHTSRYEGTFDFQEVVDQAPREKREELQAWLDFLAEIALTKVPFGLWVDEAGIARRLRIEQGGGVSMTIEYYDFGVPVEITPPRPEEIMSDEEFFKEIEAHAEHSSCDELDTSSAASSAGGAGVDYSIEADASTVYFPGDGDQVGSGSSGGSADLKEICIVREEDAILDGG